VRAKNRIQRDLRGRIFAPIIRIEFSHSLGRERQLIGVDSMTAIVALPPLTLRADGSTGRVPHCAARDDHRAARALATMGPRAALLLPRAYDSTSVEPKPP